VKTQVDAGWLAFVPVAVLGMMAIVQAWRVTTAQLTPWKGGGYGMFSTTDSQGNRPMVVSLLDDSGGQSRWIRVQLPSFDQALRQAANRVLAEPTQQAAEQLADRIAEQNWRVDAEPRAPQPGSSSTTAPIVFTARDKDRLAAARPFRQRGIKIDVWRLAITSDHQVMELAAKPLLSFERRDAPTQAGAGHVIR
jgi:hypothetical protein